MTNPMFVADLDTLKSKLRLTGLAADSAAEEILDEAILDARASFYRRLDRTVVTALLAIPFNENPTSEADVKRAIANLVEVKLVKIQLMRNLPVLFQDSSGTAQRVWNEEAPFREAGLSSLESEIKRLEAEIEESFQILDGEEEQGAEQNWRIYDGVRETAAPRPGDSVRRNPNVRTYLPED